VNADPPEDLRPEAGSRQPHGLDAYGPRQRPATTPEARGQPNRSRRVLAALAGLDAAGLVEKLPERPRR